MAKGKKVNRKKQKANLPTRKTNNLHVYANDSYLPKSLQIIAKRRKGGSVNLIGLSFQFSYALWKILHFLVESDPNRTIRLEGIEDIDVIDAKVHLITQKDYEFIQVKHSENKMDASSFWNKNILQNFIEVYLENPQATFRLVHNMNLADGNLKELASSSFTDTGLEYWRKKIEDYKNSTESNLNWKNFNIVDFLDSIKFEKLSEQDMEKDCKQIIIDKFQIDTGNEQQYMNTLHYKVFEWSKNRVAINSKDIITVIQEIKDDMAKGDVNPATQQGWITKVSYNDNLEINPDDYYEGKAARPIHIAKGLPVRRELLEEQIEKTINDFDITVLKSSSGQGKSTLAWQIGKKFSENGYSLYELHWCSDEEKIGSIISFLHSRVKIGETPLIIIDGLRQSVSRWFALAERIYELPIKILVTTREEDWYRYGADASRLSLKHLKIHMSDVEAQNIFNQLKIKGKIHNSIRNWQPAWEKVKDKGLLMEFVYLLTFGEMLRERLESQIRELANDRDSAAKIEILRLVALADLCGVKIRSTDLIEKIKTEIGLHSDRNEVLKSLENEYYIKFDNAYVEGLHPVRSEHLCTILHSNIPIEGSLIKLLPLVEQEYIYNFFSIIPTLVSDSGKYRFYDNITNFICKKRALAYISRAIDGIFSNSVTRHWERNKIIYDDVFERGSLLLFVGDSLPFINLNTLRGFKEIVKHNNNIEYLLEKLDELEKYQPEQFDIYIFLKSLQQPLKDRIIDDEYNGLANIIYWFDKLELDCPLFNKINDRNIIDSLKYSDDQDTATLAYVYSSIQPEKYNKFLEENKIEIISLLKLKTNTLTIKEEERDIHIEYLLLDNFEKANDESVSRISCVSSFMPIYDHYCTQGITPPFPGKELLKNNPDNSIKKMPKENIPRSLDLSRNKIWSRVILSKYEYPSMFEWQKQWYENRKKALDFIKNSNILFEALLERNQNRIRTSSLKLDAQRFELNTILASTKEFPNLNSKDLRTGKFSDEIKQIREWEFSLKNIVAQITNIVLPQKDNDQHLAKTNFRIAKSKIPLMQNAFSSINNQTFRYFDFSQVDTEENKWYERTFKTIAYYIENQGMQRKVFNAKSTVSTWWERKLNNELNQLHNVLTEFEENSDYVVYKPNKIIEEGILRQAVIGISNLDISNLGVDFPQIMFGLFILSELDIDQYIITFVDENAYSNTATMVSKAFFQNIKKTVEGEEYEESEYGNPIPFILTQKTLEPLNGVKLKEAKTNLLASLAVDLIIELWKLAETRKRLDKTSEIESRWLIELEKNYRMKTGELLEKLQLSYEDKFQKYKDITERIIKDEFQPTEEYFNDRLNEIIVETTI